MSGGKQQARAYSEWAVDHFTSNVNEVGSSVEFLTNVLIVNNANIE